MFKWNNLKKEKILKVQLSGKKKNPEMFFFISVKSVKYGGKSDIMLPIFNTHIALNSWL